MIKYHTFTTQTELYEKVTENHQFNQVKRTIIDAKKIVKSDTIIFDSDPFIEQTTKFFRHL